MRSLICLVAALSLAGCEDAGMILHPSRTRAVAQTPGATQCRYRDSAPVTGGDSKVCNYDCGGFQVATAVKSGGTCPSTSTYP